MIPPESKEATHEDGILEGTKEGMNVCELIFGMMKSRYSSKVCCVTGGSLLRAELSCPHKGKWGGRGSVKLEYRQYGTRNY